MISVEQEEGEGEGEPYGHKGHLLVIRCQPGVDDFQAQYHTQTAPKRADGQGVPFKTDLHEKYAVARCRHAR